MSELMHRDVIAFGGERPHTHPGEILKLDVLPGMNVTQEQLAQLLGLSRQTVNAILAAKQPVRAETALKLGALLGNSPEFWMNMQAGFDLWEAEQVLDHGLLAQLTEARRAL